MKVNDNRRWTFTIVQNDLLYDEELKPAEKLTYIILCSFSNQDNSKSVYPSLKTLTTLVNCSKPTIIKHLTTLEEKGYIEIQKERKESGDWDSNVYRILDANEQEDEEGVVKKFNKGVVKKFNYPSKKTLLKQEQTNKNNKNENSLSKDKEGNSLNIQKTLIDVKEKKKSAQKKKKRSHAEIASEKIASAKKGDVSWSNITDRDFTYYYIEKHNELFEPVTFDRYSSVSIIREDFIKRFEIPRDKVCQYIDSILEQYQTHESCQQYKKLSFNMIQKANRLIKDLIRSSEIAQNEFKREFSTNTFKQHKKSNTSDSQRSDNVF